MAPDLQTSTKEADGLAKIMAKMKSLSGVAPQVKWEDWKDYQDAYKKQSAIEYVRKYQENYMKQFDGTRFFQQLLENVQKMVEELKETVEDLKEEVTILRYRLDSGANQEQAREAIRFLRRNGEEEV